MNMRKELALAAFLSLAIFAGQRLRASAGTEPRTRLVHVFVALADNKNQGIVPVPARLGNGQDPPNNLYWGAAFGVKTFFKNSSRWKTISCAAGPNPAILERCVFRRSDRDAYLVADAYDGARIRQAIQDFLNAAAGATSPSVRIGPNETAPDTLGDADLVAYVGHDGLMDFQVSPVAGANDGRIRKFIILACASKPFFEKYMKQSCSEPVLWTTGLTAPVVCRLEAALNGCFAGENSESIRTRAAEAYDRHQK